MNNLQKYLSTSLFATAALFISASPGMAATAPNLGSADSFSVLGGTAVTCTDSVVTGDVGSGGAFTNTRCTITGGMPPATDVAEDGARAAFLSAYAALQSRPCTNSLLSTITGPMTLTPGVYCTGATALTGAGVLTLDGRGDANAVWIFKIGAALTGTGFSVVMTNGGQPCNVYWVPSEGVTMTTSAFSGNILAGGATGSITLTGGTLAGRALANVAVTMTGANVIGCAALPGSPSCKGENCHGQGKEGKCDRDGDDKEHMKCNQGVGNGPEGCDPGNSNQGNPFGSNDERGGKPGDPGRKGGNTQGSQSNPRN